MICEVCVNRSDSPLPFRQKCSDWNSNPGTPQAKRSNAKLQELGNQGTDHTQKQGAGEGQSPDAPPKKELQVTRQFPHTQAPQPRREAIDQNQDQQHHQNPANHAASLARCCASVCMAQSLTRCESGPRFENPWAPIQEAFQRPVPRL